MDKSIVCAFLVHPVYSLYISQSSLLTAKHLLFTFTAFETFCVRKWCKGHTRKFWPVKLCFVYPNPIFLTKPVGFIIITTIFLSHHTVYFQRLVSDLAHLWRVHSPSSSQPVHLKGFSMDLAHPRVTEKEGLLNESWIYRVVQKKRGHFTFSQISRKLLKISKWFFAHIKASVCLTYL